MASDRSEGGIGSLIAMLLLLVGFILMIGAAIGEAMGVSSGRQAMIRQAVDDGKAEYYLDDKHERRWRWK